MKRYFVYIMSNKKDGVLYVGSTSHLIERNYKHKNKLIEGFSKSYNTINLVYFEETNSSCEMVKRERQLKHWKREWKINLINEVNPEWKDFLENFDSDCARHREILASARMTGLKRLLTHETQNQSSQKDFWLNIGTFQF